MKRVGRIIAIACCGAALLATGCGPKRAGITAAGSTAFQPFAEKLADQFMQGNPDATVTIQGGGSAVGIQSALSGAAQIGMADLVKLPPEASNLKATVVARDGIALVVHPANPVSSLTMEQIRAIFNGAIRNWKEVGGGDHGITVVSREAGSGTRSSFEDILGGVNLMPDAIIQDSNGTIRETVANDPYAIGYLSHGLVNARIKALLIGGQPCSTEAILAGNYPLVRPIYFLTKGELGGVTKRFCDYTVSPEGQKTIHDNGLIPIK